MASERIVVGVDDSSGAATALRWALDEARRRDAVVDAVHVWHLPYVGESAGMAALSIDATELERAAAESLHAVVDEVIGSEANSLPDVTVDQHVKSGDVAGTLLRTVRELNADLLVVGSRGRGGFTGLLLGSVSQQCAQHAPCPIVIVPSKR